MNHLLRWLLVLLALGCSRREPPAASEAERSALAMLREARDVHADADTRVGSGDIDGAIVVLQAAVEQLSRRSESEAEDLANDTRARLALLLMEQGNFESADSVLAAGIEAATRPSFFVANLHTVRGKLLETRAAGTSNDALRRDAIESYARAMRMNAALQARLEHNP